MLCPRKRTCALQSAMSGKGQKRTSRSLFHHLVGAGDYLALFHVTCGIYGPVADEIGSAVYDRSSPFTVTLVFLSDPSQFGKLRSGHRSADNIIEKS